MRWLIRVVTVLQLISYLGFLRRLFRTGDGMRVPSGAGEGAQGAIAVVVPVLNEAARIDRCLESLVVQGPELGEVLVVDGGSQDSTPDHIRYWSERDARIRLVETSELPPNWNGKAWGLQVGLKSLSEPCTWVATVDADVRCDPESFARVVWFAEKNDIGSLSVACGQIAGTPGLSLVHPSLLTTLIYRFGIPGHVAQELSDVQANGQFALYRHDALSRVGGFAIARDSLCEDVTIARHLFFAGERVGFFEGDALASTVMYASGRECLQNWPRSLPLRDRFSPLGVAGTVLNALLLQVLPMVLLPFLVASGHRGRAFAITRMLIGTRIGILLGSRRAYDEARWSYWLSPLFDPLAVGLLTLSAARRRHRWRGREMAGGPSPRYERKGRALTCVS